MLLCSFNGLKYLYLVVYYSMIKAEMSNKPLVCVAMLVVQTLEENSLVTAGNDITNLNVHYQCS